MLTLQIYEINIDQYIFTLYSGDHMQLFETVEICTKSSSEKKTKPNKAFYHATFIHLQSHMFIIPLLVPDAQVIKKCSKKAKCWMELSKSFFKICRKQGKKWPGHFLSPLLLIPSL